MFTAHTAITEHAIVFCPKPVFRSRDTSSWAFSPIGRIAAGASRLGAKIQHALLKSEAENRVVDLRLFFLLVLVCVCVWCVAVVEVFDFFDVLVVTCGIRIDRLCRCNHFVVIF